MRIAENFFRVVISITNRLADLSAGLDSKKRNVLMSISLLVMALCGICRYLSELVKNLMHYNIYLSTLTAVICMIVIMICSTDRRIEGKTLKINRLFWLGWLMCFAMMLVAAVLNKVYYEYLIWAVISLVLSVPFTMIWAVRNDFGELCVNVARSAVVAGGLFFLANLAIVPFLRPEEGSDYWGIASNPNSNGLICVGLFAAAFFLFLVEKQSFVTTIVMSFCNALVLASNCRTAQIAIVLETAAGAVCYAKNTGSMRHRWSVKALIPAVLVVALLTFIIYFALNGIRAVDLNAYAASTPGGQHDVVVYKSDILRELNKLSSSRMRIWEAFLSKTRIMGNGTPQELLVPRMEGSNYAHNYGIEILYTSGVFAFAGFVMWMLSVLSYGIKGVAGRLRSKPENVLIVMVFAGYFFESMLEVLTYPTSCLLTMMLYVCIVPVAVESMEKGTDR